MALIEAGYRLLRKWVCLVYRLSISDLSLLRRSVHLQNGDATTDLSILLHLQLTAFINFLNAFNCIFFATVCQLFAVLNALTIC